MMAAYEPGTGVSRLSSIATQLFVIAVLYYALLSKKHIADINLTNNGNGEREIGWSPTRVLREEKGEENNRQTGKSQIDRWKKKKMLTY